MLFRHFSKYALSAGLMVIAATPAIASADVVELNGVYGREHSLPLCDWTTEERSLLQFIYDYDETWLCTSMADGQSCTWTGYEPSTARYWIHPRRYPRWQGDTYYQSGLDLIWPDASALYSAWNMSCERPMRRKGMAAATSGRHRVLGSVVEGRTVPGAPSCVGSVPATEVIVAEVDGGTVEHIRPGYVRGSVQIARSSYWAPTDDLRVVIQGHVDGAWQDLATTSAVTTTAPVTYAVEAYVTELTDVRLQVRGKLRCQSPYGTGYDLRDARLFIETCVPDVSNPGECL